MGHRRWHHPQGCQRVHPHFCQLQLKAAPCACAAAVVHPALQHWRAVLHAYPRRHLLAVSAAGHHVAGRHRDVPKLASGLQRDA